MTTGDPQLTVERFERTAAQQSRMGLAMPEEFLPLDGQGQGAADVGAPAASAPGRLILKVEGAEEAGAFVASWAQQEGGAPPQGVQLPVACAACGARAGAGFEASAHRPVAAFIRDSLIVRATCSSCTAASAEVRSTGGVAPQGSRLRCVPRWWRAPLAPERCLLPGSPLRFPAGPAACPAYTPAFIKSSPHRLRVETATDLERAVLQSASASIAVPELELALSTGSNAGMATTVGQLISNVRWGGGAHGWVPCLRCLARPCHTVHPM